MSKKTAEKTYELVYIVRPNLDEDSVDRSVVSIEEHIKNLGATLLSTEKKGRRRLAYEVKKMRDGYYVISIFKSHPENLAAIKRMLSLSEDIIRSLIIVLDEQPSAFV